MTTALSVEPGLTTHRHDVMAVSSGTVPCLTSSSWGGEGSVGHDHSTGLVVTKLLTRPKTSSSVCRASVPYASTCAIQVLGDKPPQPQPQPQPQHQERPKTSVVRIKDKERPAPYSRECSGFMAVPGKELALPICTTQKSRSLGTEKEMLSITTRLRNRSALGARNIPPIIGTSAREKSAALLKELSLSFSMPQRDGPVSPFKDCLREQWGSLHGGDPLLPTELPLPSPLTPVPVQDITEGVHPPNNTSQNGGKTVSRIKSGRTSALIDINETLAIRSASPTKDLGELTHRSSSPVKDFRSRNLRKSSRKRTQSTGSVSNYFSANDDSDSKPSSSRTDEQSVEKDVVLKSPKIITINRLPSPSPVKGSPRTNKPRERKTDSGTKSVRQVITLSAPDASPEHNDSVLSPKSVRSSKETLTECPLQREAPSQVTNFDMAITSVKEALHSPRTRAASFLSDLGQPVSVHDDTVLKMCSLYGHHPPSSSPSLSHNDAKETDTSHTEQRRTDPLLSSERICEGSENIPVWQGEHKRDQNIAQTGMKDQQTPMCSGEKEAEEEPGPVQDEACPVPERSGFVLYQNGFVLYQNGFVLYQNGFVLCQNGFVLYQNQNGCVLYQNGFVLFQNGFVLF
ncbi:hypothetical protein ACOMHN_043984 [Nucella lapillus]